MTGSIELVQAPVPPHVGLQGVLLPHLMPSRYDMPCLQSRGFKLPSLVRTCVPCAMRSHALPRQC